MKVADYKYLSICGDIANDSLALILEDVIVTGHDPVDPALVLYKKAHCRGSDRTNLELVLLRAGTYCACRKKSRKPSVV